MPIPKEAWLLAWTCLLGQVVNLAQNGRQDDNLLLPSMLLGAAVVAFFAHGVLRARMVRVVIVAILFGLGLLFFLIGAIDEPGAGTMINLVVSAAEVAFFVAFLRTPYFAWQRTRPKEPGPSLAGLVAIAVLVGAIGGVIGASDEGFRAEVSV